MTAFRSWQAVPFVVSVGRSGSTLLRLMLDAHSDLAIPAETAWFGPVARTSFLDHPDPQSAFCDVVTAMATFADLGLDEATVRARVADVDPFDPGNALRAIGQLYAGRHGKTRWGDKSPAHVVAIPAIRALLPESRIIHLVRDVRDVVASFRRTWFSPATTVEGIAADWAARVSTARNAGHGQEWYLELRYEDLVADPEPNLRLICRHTDLEFETGMLDAHHRAADRLAEISAFRADFGVTRDQRIALHAPTTRPPSTETIGRWRTDLTAEEITRIDAVAGSVRAGLGYHD